MVVFVVSRENLSGCGGYFLLSWYLANVGAQLLRYSTVYTSTPAYVAKGSQY